ncbi:hypothetical protein B0H16DRAFT_1800016 [Mycena metata]|uniref:F-box domain-containing protein n=1 Tax=Mycena metata TaxID=1033252 RepID=A0AAD7NK40_9AGAR|nr:hypothetical protein B0H16DRAFT_1800016 [Mycena metata]
MEDELNTELPSRLAKLLRSNCPPSDSETAAIEDAIAVRTRAVARLNSNVDPLLAKRDDLVASLHSLSLLLSATRTLPVDVLIEIFRATVELGGDPGWRAIAIESPELWTSIDIDNSPVRKLRPTGYPVKKLEVLLQRSGSHVLSIRFCTIKQSFIHDDAPVTPHAVRIFRMLVAASERWGSLFLRCSPAWFPFVADLKGRLPVLRRLTLDLCFDNNSLTAFEVVPQLSSLALLGLYIPDSLSLPWSQITRFNCQYGLWQHHVGVLERVRNIRECHLVLANWAPNEHTGTLVLPKLNKLYVARGDFLEFDAPLLDELVVEPLSMTPPSDALGNLAALIQQSSCQLTKLCLIAAIPSIADVPKLTTVLELLPSLLNLCVQSRDPKEAVAIDHLVISLSGIPRLVPHLEALTLGGYPCDWTTLVDTIWNRRHANPAGSSPLRAFSIFHIERIHALVPDELQRLETLRHEGLELNILEGPDARAAMVAVPFFHAGASHGKFWAPDSEAT